MTDSSSMKATRVNHSSAAGSELRCPCCGKKLAEMDAGSVVTVKCRCGGIVSLPPEQGAREQDST